MANRPTMMLQHVGGKDGEYREFKFAGYGDPLEVCRYADGYAMNISDGGLGDDVWYLNVAGYAQKVDPQRPPGRMPLEQRVLLIPMFEEL